MAITLEAKQKIVELRNKGMGSKMISGKLGIKRDQVRDFLKTNKAIEMGVNKHVEVVYSYEYMQPKQHDCRVCGIKFRKKESGINSIIFCSLKCKEKDKELKKLAKVKKCQKCGKEFLPRSNLQQYCSTECRTITLECKLCGKTFTRLNKSCHRGQFFCSQKCASDDKRKSHEKYYEEFSRIHKGKIVPIERYKADGEPLRTWCVDCQKETIRPARRYIENGIGCSHCAKRLSVAEDRIEQWLIDNNVKHNKQHSFSDLVDKQLLRYDFAILGDHDDVIMLIEYDGRQHYVPVKQFGGQEEFEEQQKKDRMKSEYAKERNIPLLRINYRQKNNLEKILKEYIIV